MVAVSAKEEEPASDGGVDRHTTEGGMGQHRHPIGGGGMSRAAKKRAKKKEKKKRKRKHDHEHRHPEQSAGGDGDVGIDDSPGSNKKKKAKNKEADQAAPATQQQAPPKKKGILKKSAPPPPPPPPLPEHDDGGGGAPVDGDGGGGGGAAAVEGGRDEGGGEEFAALAAASIRRRIDFLCDPTGSSGGGDGGDFVTVGGASRLSDLVMGTASGDDGGDRGGGGGGGSTTGTTKLTCEGRARAALEFLLKPSGVSADQFYRRYWEKQPICVRCNGAGSKSNNAAAAVDAYRHRLDGFLSLEGIRRGASSSSSSGGDQMIMRYGRDLNVTLYRKDPKDGKRRRVTLDSELIARGNEKQKHMNASNGKSRDDGRVDSATLFDEYFTDRKCTIRLLCPHKHSDAVHGLVSLLEHEWGSMVGANAYLTPPAGSQGFAPHYDDIEALILQLEGRKHWRVYAPIKPDEILPRASSEDYTDDDLVGKEPVLDVVLEPGDFLYMPRGWIHQGRTLPSSGDETDGDGHSLHLTISAMQQWAWVDLMESLLPEAVQSLASSETTTALREGLPRQFLQYMGAIHDPAEETLPDILKQKLLEDAAAGSENGTDGDDTEEARRAAQTEKLREEFKAEAGKRIAKVAEEAIGMLDAVCDQMGKRFLSDRVPPAYTPEERALTSQGRPSHQQQPFQVPHDALVRLARPGIARMVLEGGMAVLYHCADNSKVFHENPLSPMEFEMDDAPAIEQLLKTTEPMWVCVSDLIHDTLEDKVGVAQALYDEGILAVRE